MAGVEFSKPTSSQQSQTPTNPFRPPHSPTETSQIKIDPYGVPVQGQVMDTEDIPTNDHRLQEDSCQSEEEEMEGEGVGPLQIVLDETMRGEEERRGHGGPPFQPHHHHHHHQEPILSDVDEEDEDGDGGGDSRRRAAGRMHRKSLRPLLREPFGNLTVTKFPLNNNGQHPNYAGRGGGPFGENFSKQGGNGRRMPSLLEQQFQLMSSLPQTSPNNEPLNNNNNSIPSLNNNNKEGKLPFLPIMHGGKSPERQGPQRRNHQGHFVNPPSETNYPPHGGGTYHQGGGKDRNKSPPSNHSSPTIRDLKPDLAGEGGLNMLSRSLGTALLNLASLGNFPTFQQPHHHHGHRSPNPKSADVQSPLLAPLNLSNGGASNYLAQCMAAQQSMSTGGQPGNRSSPSPTFAHPNNLPQLILASGSIVQGIQGAQLLIPSPQGLMTQTVLTIPITQPLSPLTPPSGSPPVGSSRKSQSQQHVRPTGSPSPPGTGTHDFGNPCQAQGPIGHIPLISDKLMSLERNLRDGLSSAGNRSNSSTIQPNGFRMISSGSGGRRENSSSPLISAALNNNQQHHPQHLAGSSISSHFQQSGSICPTSQLSPSSSHMSHEEEDNSDFLDRCSDNDDDTMMDGINLDEIKEFAKAFKLRRLSLGLTQTQVGQALSVTEGPAYSQSAICSALAWQLAQSQTNRTLPIQPQQSMFEKLDITPKSAQKIKPVLEKWMKEAEDRYRTGNQNLNEFVGMEPSKKRKRRTSFTPQALEILNTHFERNTHPSGAEITTLAHQLGYEREVIRIWFCNKRQALKNTVRMMSKAGSPA